MRSFKKIIISTSLFLAGGILMSAVLLGCYFNTSFQYYQDVKVRENLAGTLDTLFIGSSRGLCAYDSEAVDSSLNCKSYNLSGSALSPTGKLAIIKEDLERNNIKNVIIGVEDDDLNYKSEEWRSEGEINLIPRLSSRKDRISYFFRNVRVEDYPYVYSVWMNSGVKSLISYVLHPGSDGTELKTIKKNAAVDMFLSNEEILSLKGSRVVGETLPDCREKLTSLIELCQSYGAKVTLIILPDSENLIWKTTNFDEFLSEYIDISNEFDCDLFDFNLIKNRENYFNDHTSFSDSMHMSEQGAASFSKLYCEIAKKIENNEDASDMFYGSYEEAVKHMEYYNIYQQLSKDEKA